MIISDINQTSHPLFAKQRGGRGVSTCEHQAERGQGGEYVRYK
jgi:hypothetical protein